MNPEKKKSLWDSIPDYQRRNQNSVKPPSERIDPDLPGAHFWVIIVTNWNNLHPLMQDVLYDWYLALSKSKGSEEEEIDPTSTEALYKRLELLDQKLRAFDLERSNLEEELNIRDRDFQRLRSITGKQQKENIEVQHELGKSFQVKIMEKQEEIDQQADYIKELEEKISKLESGEASVTSSEIDSNDLQDLQQNLEDKINILQELNDKVENLSDKLEEKEKIIEELKAEISRKDEKIKEIKELLKL